MFLATDDLYSMAFTDGFLKCEFIVIEHGIETLIKTSAPYEEVHAELTAYSLAAKTRQYEGAARARAKSSEFLRVAVLESYFPNRLAAISQSSASKASFIHFPQPGLYNTNTMVCVELMAIRSEVDLIAGFWLSAEMALTMRHSPSIVEHYLQIPIISATAPLINMLNYKDKLASTMTRLKLDRYIPGVYSSPDSVTYPCLVKYTDGFLGDKITLAFNRSQLDDALLTLNGHSYLLQVSREMSDQIESL